MFAIEFDKLEWESPARGVQFKAFQHKGKLLRLVEFAQDFVEPDWCEKGHAGMVLVGEIEVAFKDRVVCYPEDSALLIPPGQETGHRARAVTPLVRLFLSKRRRDAGCAWDSHH